MVGAVRVEVGSGWYGAESFKDETWRWSSGKSELRLRNASGGPLATVVRGRVAALDARSVRIFLGDAMVWSGEIGEKQVAFKFGCTVPEGGALLRFVADKVGRKVGTDPRMLSFNIFDLEVVVQPADGQP